MASAERQAESFGVPWETVYGYEQAVQEGDIIYVSGQLSHDMDGNLVAPAPLDEAGKPTDFGNMAAQMRQSYVNAVSLLARFGATLGDVVEETLFVIDMDAGFAAAGPVRQEMYGTARPRVASNIIGTTRLTRPEALVEITLRAVLRGEPRP